MAAVVCVGGATAGALVVGADVAAALALFPRRGTVARTTTTSQKI